MAMKNIIFIEKEAFLVEMLKMILKEHEINLIVPDQGIDYLYIFSDVMPSLAIIDISSFEGDLLEFLSQKESIAEISQIPIIFSGREEDKKFFDQLELNDKFWMSKPLDPRKIFDQLENFL